MSSRINKTSEDIFQHGESLFLSSVIIINENGERCDRILLLFANHLVLLSHSQTKPNEFDFDFQVPFVSSAQSSGHSLIHFRKITNPETLNKNYGSATIDQSSLKYCLELTSTNGSSFLIICSTNYDLKMLIEIISNQLSKLDLRALFILRQIWNFSKTFKQNRQNSVFVK